MLVCAGTLLAVQFLLFNWAEVKRWYDFKNPGSQGDGSFFGITDDFKGVENGYPGRSISVAELGCRVMWSSCPAC